LGWADVAADLLDPLQAALDIAVEFVLVIPVVSERRVDLPEG
jgi:hypothetical protein